MSRGLRKRAHCLLDSCHPKDASEKVQREVERVVEKMFRNIFKKNPVYLGVLAPSPECYHRAMVTFRRRSEYTKVDWIVVKNCQKFRLSCLLLITSKLHPNYSLRNTHCGVIHITRSIPEDCKKYKCIS